ncbi:MAG: iron chelate uptake ABC transporter family permease subunit [Blautia sp.]
MFFGTDHKKMLPLSALSGSIFLIWADVASRIIIPKSEVPNRNPGIHGSGAPCFILSARCAESYGFGGEKS